MTNSVYQIKPDDNTETNSSNTASEATTNYTGNDNGDAVEGSSDSCEKGQFSCGNSIQCIPREFYCDGTKV